MSETMEIPRPVLPGRARRTVLPSRGIETLGETSTTSTVMRSGSCSDIGAVSFG